MYVQADHFRIKSDVGIIMLAGQGQTAEAMRLFKKATAAAKGALESEQGGSGVLQSPVCHDCKSACGAGSGCCIRRQSDFSYASMSNLQSSCRILMALPPAYTC